ncbi:hypothetical protein [Burkholderia pseudomultivorans]|uniref:hypothetical protein n=1 Tax=Burkholderia pseudomultivorans TaxID=1207504 RepID=UPI0012D950F0|nr:hypothetical protein [Burkholderia pseudomultivorans]
MNRKPAMCSARTIQSTANHRSLPKNDPLARIKAHQREAAAILDLTAASGMEEIENISVRSMASPLPRKLASQGVNMFPGNPWWDFSRIAQIS